MAGAFAAGLLGAAQGALGTLSNEYDNINKEKRVIRAEDRGEARGLLKEGRDEKRQLDKEDRLEDRAIRAENRMIEAQATKDDTNRRAAQKITQENDENRSQIALDKAEQVRLEEEARFAEDPKNSPQYRAAVANDLAGQDTGQNVNPTSGLTYEEERLASRSRSNTPSIGAKEAKDSVRRQTLGYFNLTDDEIVSIKDSETNPLNIINNSKNSKATKNAFKDQDNINQMQAQISRLIVQGELPRIDMLARSKQITDEGQLASMAEASALRGSHIVNEWKTKVAKMEDGSAAVEAKAEWDKEKAADPSLTPAKFVTMMQKKDEAVLNRVLDSQERNAKGNGPKYPGENHPARAKILSYQNLINDQYWSSWKGLTRTQKGRAYGGS